MNTFTETVITSLSATSTLDAAFRKLKEWKFPLAKMEPIAQDEFSHDIVIPFRDNKQHLVISAT